MVNDRAAGEPAGEAHAINFNLLAGKEQNAPVFTPGKTTHEKFVIDGRERTADIHIPSNWDGKTPLPVLYYFKALHQGGPEPESFTGLSQKADKQGVAVVYLDGEGTYWHGWNNGQKNFGDGADENKYLNAVHSRLSAELLLDPKRQGLAGFSHGGSEAYALAPLNSWVSSVQTA